MNAQIYYTEYGNTEARDLRHDVSYNDKEPSQEEFESMYEHVGSQEVNSDNHNEILNAIWQAWNRGSGGESEAFINAETRSLSVADVVVIEDTAYLCVSFGWEEIDVEAGE